MHFKGVINTKNQVGKDKRDTLYILPPTNQQLKLNANRQAKKSKFIEVIRRLTNQVYASFKDTLLKVVHFDTLNQSEKNNTYNIKITRKGTNVECWICDQVVASYRIYEEQENMFGLFVQEGSAFFNNLEWRT